MEKTRRCIGIPPLSPFCQASLFATAGPARIKEVEAGQFCSGLGIGNSLGSS